MNKKAAIATLLVSGALVGVTTQAHAQSSVTLYGMIDTAIRYANHASADGSAQTVLGNGAIAPSRWGLRMTEGLGGGVSVLAELESGLNIGTGTNPQTGREFGRTSIVGVEGPFGRLTLGREYTVLYEATAKNDVYRMSNTNMTGFAVGNYTASTRLDNGIKYQKKLGDFSFGAQHNFAGSSSTPQGTSNGAKLAFDRGNLHLGGAYQTLNDKTSFFAVTVPATNQKTWTFGGSYIFGKDQLFAYYTHSKLNGYFDQLGSIGLAHRFAPDLVWQNELNVDHLSRARGAGNRFNATTEINYALTKRTSIYAEVDYTKLTNAWKAFASQPTFDGSFYGASSRVGVMAGMRHNF